MKKAKQIMVRSRSTATKAIIFAVVLAIVITVLIAGLNYFIFPLIPESFRTITQRLSNIFLLALLIVSEFFQIAGVIKDLSSSSIEASQGTNSRTEHLIEQIQNSLYGNDNDLPKVLTLCMTLCDLAKLPKDYKTWLRYELEGYTGTIDQNGVNDDSIERNAWLDKWASHRLCQTYVKFQYTSSDTGRTKIDNLPVRRFFIAFPINEVIRMLDEARRNSIQEMYHILYDVDREAFNELKSFVAKPPLRTQLPYDLRVFLSMTVTCPHL